MLFNFPKGKQLTIDHLLRLYRQCNNNQFNIKHYEIKFDNNSDITYYDCICTTKKRN
jgi:hypothetical protein